MAGDLFTDPVQLFGFSFIIITMIIQLMLALKVYRNYLMNRSKPTLSFSLTFCSWGLALMFLALERVALSEVGIRDFGITVAYVALVFSAIAVVFLDLFAFYATFPNSVKKLIVIPIILIIIYLFGVFYSINQVKISLPPSSEIIFPPYVDIFMFFTIVPLFFIPIIILAYYSHTMRSRSPPHANRAIWLAIAIFLVILSYIPEILGPADLINYLRCFYTIATIIFYFCFTKFIELRWAQKIRQLYICLVDKGTCLYDYSFKKEESMEGSLVTGFIAGIYSLVQEITHTQKRLKVIDVEDIKIVLERGNKILGILLTEENYTILRTKLRRLIEIFEVEFENELAAFSGRVDVFKRTEKFIDRIFTYKEIF